MDNQDRKQRMAVMSQFGVEFYKILTGCFLLLFVPQECNDHTCSMDEVFENSDIYYRTSLIFNGITFFMFLALYGIELYRENTLIKYLDVNPAKARSNESVQNELQLLSDDHKQIIRNNRVRYNNICKASSIMFMINNVLSGIVLYQNQVGSKTISVYFTNVLFTGSKLGTIYGIVTADPFVFYSAYMTRKVQFNDVDKDYLIEEQVKENSAEETLTHL